MTSRPVDAVRTLRRIAENRCGIPGHAVAVGCKSSTIAAAALKRMGEPLPESWRDVPEDAECPWPKVTWEAIPQPDGVSLMVSSQTPCEFAWWHDGSHSYEEATDG